MEFFGNKSECLYFIYGLTFFTLGVSALQQSTRKYSNYYMLSSLKYLAWFGITHGLSEWVAMFTLAHGHNYADFHYIFWLKMLLNAIAFSFLLIYGLVIMDLKSDKGNRMFFILWLLLGVWTLSFYAFEYYFKYSLNFSWCLIYCTLNRYFIGLPAGIITGIALFKNATYAKKLNFSTISLKFNLLGILFIVYGISSGLIVSKSIFFPSTIINQEVFEQVFLIPIELLRAIIAVLITIIFIRVVNIFTWEIDEKINRILNQQAADHARRKLGRELHDVTIQKLFSTGLRLESLCEDATDALVKGELEQIKEDLNGIISDVRSFIDLGYKEKLEIEDLSLSIQDLISQFIASSKLDIRLECNISPFTLAQLSPQKLTQIYYIVQEGLSNINKHSKATKATVILSSNINDFMVEISDNGSGFNPRIRKSKSYGLTTMRERAAIADGCLTIKSDSSGTKINVAIPWEACEDESKLD